MVVKSDEWYEIIENDPILQQGDFIDECPIIIPPIREHLSQAFARFFMRVGLPFNIPPFKKN